MRKIDEYTILSELLIERCDLIPVVNRFGIGFGLGDKSIEELCAENEINIHFLLAIINLYLDPEYHPETDLQQFDVTLVWDYLKNSVETYVNYSVSNIEKHFTPLIAMSNGANEELKLLHSLFYKFKSEISEHLQKDLKHVSDYPTELLNDLKTIMVKHVSNALNRNLAYAVVFSIDALEKELAFHNRILNRILRFKLDELDAKKIEHLSQSFSDDHKTHGMASSTLTNREIEVLKLIVQGHLNKEIADQLNISFNTVLSHRKNIISKTGIKTISGLTFYSISNGYVSPGDFEI